MTAISKPTDINKIWASLGDVIAPSDTKINNGWAVEIPPRQYFNYIDNKQDQAIAHMNQYGIPVWDAVTEYQAGKSLVQGSDGLTYKARTTHSNVNPVTDTSFVSWTKALSGGLLNIQVFKTSGTYTPTPGTVSVVVEVQGGGGAGGGVAAAAGQTTAGTGGGGGGYGLKRITSAFSGVSVTVGAGGTGVAGNGAGGNGGTSSFGALITATGGTGGSSSTATTTAIITSGVAGNGGTATLSDVLTTGGQGGVGLMGPAFALAGQGGTSFFGGGAPYSSVVTTSVVSGTAAVANTGGGGSGAAGFNNGATAAGGNGGSGIVIVWEYLA